MMTSPESNGVSTSWLSGALRGLTSICIRRPRLAVYVLGASAILAALFAWQQIEFKTDRSDLIDPRVGFQQRWLRYTSDFGTASDVVVVIEARSPDAIKTIQDEIGQRLSAKGSLFRNVLFKVEPGELRSKGLYYLQPDVLAQGLERLEEYAPVLEGDWDLVRLQSLVPRLRLMWDALPRAQGDEAERTYAHLERLTASLAATVNDANDFSNPWPDVVPVDPRLREQGDQTVYLLNEAGTMGFVMASPTESDGTFEGASKAIDQLRGVLANVRSRFPQARLSLTGIPVLENDEMRRSAQDSSLASILSFIGVAALYVWGFRGLRHPILGMLMLAVGMAWSYGFAALAVGHLNILSISFAAILIGLGCDYSIHILSGYLDRRHRGDGVETAMRHTVGTIGGGIVTGAVTTALAFFCAAFTDFLGVSELGIISSGGILVCLLATFTFLPAVVVWADRDTQPKTLPIPFQGLGLKWMTLRWSGLVLGGTLATGAMIAWAGCDWSHGWPTPRVSYDHNLLNLQATGLESVDTQRRIFEGSNHSLLYAVSIANSPEEARELRRRFEKLPTVHHVEELASRLPEAPASQTRLLVQGFDTYLSRLPSEVPPPQPSQPSQIGQQIEELWRSVSASQNPRARRLAANLDQFLDRFAGLSAISQMEFVAQYDYRLAYALLAQLRALRDAADPNPVTPEDLPAALRSRFISDSGRWLLQVYPRDQIWDMQPLSQFVSELRSVDPEVTGTPLQNFEASRQIKLSYEICAGYALAVIVLVLLLDFLKPEHAWLTFGLPLLITGAAALVAWGRGDPASMLALLATYTTLTLCVALVLDPQSVTDTVLTMATPGLGLAITLGLLPLFDLQLNPANLIILPLILGIGVDHGVHIMHDFHSKPGRRYFVSPSVVNSVVLTSTTTMVGFGSMMVASHRGLYSLGAVLTIGVGACLYLSLVPLPALLSWLTRGLPLPESEVPAVLPQAPPLKALPAGTVFEGPLVLGGPQELEESPAHEEAAEPRWVESRVLEPQTLSLRSMPGPRNTRPGDEDHASPLAS